MNVYMKRMRMLLLLSLLLLCGKQAKAGDYKPLPTTDHITIEGAELVPGNNGTYDLLIKLVGSQIYTAFEMDVKFPPGLDVVMTSKDKPYVLFYKGDGTIYPKDEIEDTWEHQLVASYGKVGTQVLRLSCFSSTNAELTATSGTLLTMRVKASPWLKPGDVTLSVSKLHLITKQDAQQYNCDDQTLTLHAASTSTASLTVSGDNHFSTCVLPFDVPTLPQSLKAYSAKRLDESQTAIVLDEVKALKAYTPYILYAENGYSGTLSGEVDASRYVEVAHDGFLYGAVAAQKQSTGYVLQNQGDGTRFYAMNGVEYAIPEGKCWLAVDAAQAAAASYGIVWDDTPTGIAHTVNGQQASSTIYTLGGKRVNKMLPGGIYVVNGQKILKPKQ